MAVFALRIVKQEPYQGGLREFGNTYHYQTAAGQTFDDLDVATFVADQERQITGSNVDFVRWETWGPTDGPAIDNVIRDSGELTGAGSGAAFNAYKEICVLIVWPISRSPVTNRRRWLRKFIRMPGLISVTLANDVYTGEAALPQAAKDAFNAYASAVADVPSGGGSIFLCNENGDGQAQPQNVATRDYFYTRDIGK